VNTLNFREKEALRACDKLVSGVNFHVAGDTAWSNSEPQDIEG
jgi:hypothetical protein